VRSHPKIPPLAVTLAAAALMWLLARASPAPEFVLPARGALALGLMLAGAGIALAAVLAFRRAGTTVNPLAPERTSSLVVQGVYRLSRHPMYLGMTLILLGWAVWLANVSALAVLPAFIACIDRFQIAPEEASMARLFGGDFLAYKARTRRWL
jgi:protein-S-isoprenylcysteine O-methyltransferase Ste14